MTTEPRHEAENAETEPDLMTAAGMVSTPEGRARARALLAKAREESPRKNAAIRAQLAAKQAEMFPLRPAAGE